MFNLEVYDPARISSELDAKIVRKGHMWIPLT